ncbi:MAG: UDP-N-acetylmuramoyl-L-alanyl-D-glutamate--2,6-diaminopimelate ligase [Bacteroidota bacterium]|nr:UDP-N-acetylmuramoyl-L-alanyl-D-glutamate--2,6-diaminopimelate ligase [Bacteroidota bacterium]
MKKLNDILDRVKIVEIKGSSDITIDSVCFDTRKAESGSLFIAVKGTQVDGHDFIPQAIEKGVIAIVCERIPDELKQKSLTDSLSPVWVVVENTEIALAIISSNYYDNPTEKLKIIGITGTNGKTTTATLLYSLFRKLGYKAGLFSTVRNIINDREVAATHTTPDAIQLNRLFSEMVNDGCKYVFMEVSSHAIVQNRIKGIRFTGGVFTNITHDHLDYHKTFKEYIRAKKMFFDELPSEAFALTNVDDPNGNIMLQNTSAIKKTYSLQTLADFKGKIIENEFSGLQLNFNGNDFYSRLVGKFNAYNLLSVYATACLLGEDSALVLKELSDLSPVEGRFDYIKGINDITAIVDYAHTPDALKNVLATIASIKKPSQKIITVVGCGGNRDKTKRPEMAQISVMMSDKVILTSDNPRNENPEEIIEDMYAGIDENSTLKVLKITNRKEAIRTACALAAKSDIILIAGKGHEKYQEIKGVRTPFDDKQIVKELLKLRN